MIWQILIIDPEKSYSDFVLKETEGIALNIIIKNSIEDAVSYVKTAIVDVVLLDDERTDEQLLEIIQELKSGRMPPDIFITGEGMPDKVESAVKSGASAYLTRKKFQSDLERQLSKLRRNKESDRQANIHLSELHEKMAYDRPKILVVDDSSILRRIIMRMLGENEYEVVTAVDGKDCLEKIKTFQPDVILSDIVMPVLGGIELCIELKNKDEYKNIPVLLMSTESEVGRKINGFNVGAADFLTKPFEEEELKARLTTHFLQKKLIEGLEYENKKRKKAEEELREYTNSLEDIVAERTREIQASNEQLTNEVLERKKIQIDLEKTQKRYRDIVETINEWIWEIGVDGTFSYISPKVEAVLGFSVDEILGQSPFDLLPEEEVPVLKQFLKKSRDNNRELKTIEQVYINKDGLHSVIESSMVPFFDQDKKMLGYRGVSRDVTDLKQSKDEKEILERQLMQAEKMASIGQLAAGVAHEINNPIGFVNSNLNSLSDYVDDIRNFLKQHQQFMEYFKSPECVVKLNTDEKEHLDSIDKSKNELDIDFIIDDSKEIISDCREGVDRVKNIVSALKDFAHPGNEKNDYADINSNIESTLVIVWNELKYNTTIIKKYGDIPEVYCNVQQLNQVFMNLFVNAAQSIESQGTITIETRAPDAEHVEILISDTGAGIPDEIKNKIFDPFFTTKDVGKGTGLGLNLSYNIITRHGGEIEVESRFGEGTTFRIILKVNSGELIDDEKNE